MPAKASPRLFEPEDEADILWVELARHHAFLSEMLAKVERLEFSVEAITARYVADAHRLEHEILDRDVIIARLRQELQRLQWVARFGQS